MPGRGGDGWIYFKISGSSEQGAIRIFGEYPNQTIENLQWLCDINDCSMYNPTFNPGLAMNQVRNELDEQYCTICQTYIKKNSNTFHCNFCNVCIEGFDHHCVWIGKCVGNKNKIWFYAMIGSVAVIYVFIIIAFIYFYIHYKK